jgi:hypothetical protein
MSKSFFNFKDHSRRKESSRQEDARALQERQVSIEALRAVNEPFRELAAHGSHVNLSAARSLS